MIVGVINFSGNVGKSTVARHLLCPRIPGAKLLSIESINSDGRTDDALRGKQFGELQVMLQTVESAVVDVGASNIEEFIKMMGQYKGSHADFDFFVVPVVPAMKQQRDTISTIEALASLGVPADKIRVLLNQVDAVDSTASIFSGLHEYQRAEGKYTACPEAVMHLNDIYPLLANSSATIAQILGDTSDYKDKIKRSTDPAERLRFAQLVALKRLAAGVQDELDTVFGALFHQGAAPSERIGRDHRAEALSGS